MTDQRELLIFQEASTYRVVTEKKEDSYYLKLVVRSILTILLLLVISAFGGFLFRASYNPGLISYEGITFPLSSLDSWEFMKFLAISKYLVFGIPTAVLVTICANEGYNKDFIQIRRAAMFMAVLILISAAYSIASWMYTADSAYITGPFEWMFGKVCQTTDSQWRLRSLYYVAMSLIGLMFTVPIGIIFFIFGFGWEFTFSGVYLGMAFYLGKLIPSNLWVFRQGYELGCLFFGTWFFLSLISQLRSQSRFSTDASEDDIQYSNAPEHKRFRRSFDGSLMRTKITYTIPVILILALFMASTIAYGTEPVPSGCNGIRNTTLLGMSIVCASILASVIVMWTYHYVTRRVGIYIRVSEETTLDEPDVQVQFQSTPTHFEGPPQIIFPLGQNPYRFIVGIVRVLSILNCLFVFGLGIYLVIENIVSPHQCSSAICQLV
eukprot:TRINITY_DN12575_c0_g1_i1.p1 TRINITY_DN12575_c0_g1~~TRINITY_DN12575_c0_g1_i1.p1  ORF type:complete len:436 (-),score=119.46 TRINITY_DN12575_c0_g1_i1:66-1373(-)